MKKMFYALALIVSSFFLFNIDVKAVEVDLSIFSEEFFENRDKLFAFLEQDKTRSDDYLITYNKRSYSYTYYILPLGFDKTKATCNSSNCSFAASSNIGFYDPVNNRIYNNTYTVTFNYGTPEILLDSNIDLIYNGSSSYTYTYSIGEESETFEFKKGDIIPNYMYFYNKYSGNAEDHTHDSELSIIQSFYEVSISKISYLAESISSNYIYLSIFGVFILIFVFELIFRRYL